MADWKRTRTAMRALKLTPQRPVVVVVDDEDQPRRRPLSEADRAVLRKILDTPVEERSHRHVPQQF